MNIFFQRSTNDAPDISTFRDNKPTLLVSWWCTLYAITIIVVRLCGRYIRAEKIFKEDGIMILAITPILIRMSLVHIILLYGTNNTKTDGLSDRDILRRQTGSQLVLASRIFYAASLWTIKYSVSIFLRSLTISVWQRSHQRILRYLHIFLAVTFLGTIISDLAACQPVTHYWQVTPDPGPKCRTGSAHLLTTGILNIITNLALVLFPLPMILRSSLPKTRKFTIALRLALPLLSAGFTAYAIPHIIGRHYAQAYRTLLSSIDILLAAGISNAIVLASLLQDRGYKKTKYKHGAEREGFHVKGMGKVPGWKESAAGIWGSDEDLMGAGRGTEIGKQASIRRGSLIMLDDLGEGSKDDGGLKVPAQAKLQEIKVETQWDVQVEHEDGKK